MAAVATAVAAYDEAEAPANSTAWRAHCDEPESRTSNAATAAHTACNSVGAGGCASASNTAGIERRSTACRIAPRAECKASRRGPDNNARATST